MSTKDEGGPAFPRPAGDYNGTRSGNVGQIGMSMRDYFAAQAMQALISSMPADAMIEVCEEDRVFHEHAADLVKHAFWYADAMLKERTK